MSSRRAVDTEPFAMACLTAAGVRYTVDPTSSSSSSPALIAAAVLCVAPQSDCTWPWKPHSFFSTSFSR